MNELELTPAEQERLDLFSQALSSWFDHIKSQAEAGLFDLLSQELAPEYPMIAMPIP